MVAGVKGVRKVALVVYISRKEGVAVVLITWQFEFLQF